MHKTTFPKLVIAVVVIITAAVVGYTGLTIWRVNDLPSSGELDTSTWQTYRNDEFGFEMKYPPQIEPPGCLNIGCNRIATELPNDTTLLILPCLDAEYFAEYGEPLIVDSYSLAQVVAKYTTSYGVIEGIFVRTSVGGVEGIRIITNTPIEGLLLLFPPVHQEVVFLYMKDRQKVYIISHYAKAVSKAFEEDNVIFHKMLSTLRFFESPDQ